MYRIKSGVGVGKSIQKSRQKSTQTQFWIKYHYNNSATMLQKTLCVQIQLAGSCKLIRHVRKLVRCTSPCNHHEVLYNQSQRGVRLSTWPHPQFPTCIPPWCYVTATTCSCIYVIRVCQFLLFSLVIMTNMGILVSFQISLAAKTLYILVWYSIVVRCICPYTINNLLRESKSILFHP